MDQPEFLERKRGGYFSGIERDIEIVDRDTVLQHLDAFINAFVSPEYRPRWIQYLIEKPVWKLAKSGVEQTKKVRKVEELLYHFGPYKRGSKRFYKYAVPDDWSEPRFSDRNGILYIPGCEGVWLTLNEAFTICVEWDISAIFSITAGVDVIVFCHDGDVIQCKNVLI